MGLFRKRPAEPAAYLYCDHCGSLVDYDFRLANSGTNAALTNTVFHRLIKPVQPDLDRALVLREEDRYRELLHGVYAEWLRECPQAASPRAKTDEDFRDRMAAYGAETQLRRDFDLSLMQLQRQMNAMIDTLQRQPSATGPWLVSDGIWQVAALFKQLMEQSYQMFDATGVSAMDPDEAPPGVQLRWRRAQDPARSERGDLRVLRPQAGHRRRRDTVPELRCPLSFPVGTSGLECPYCHTGTHRV